MTPPRRPQFPDWDPDPLHVEPDELEPRLHSRVPSLGVAAFAVVVILLAILAAILLTAAPRAAAIPTAPQPSIGAVGLVQASPAVQASASGSPLPGAPLVSGIASHVGTRFGSRYLALPEHRWGRPGIRVRICGAGGCVVRTSTDAGPDLAMQRAGRIADLNWWDFAWVCGVAEDEPDPGLCAVTVEYGIADVPLPATDTKERP